MARQRPPPGIYAPFGSLPVRSTCVSTAVKVRGGARPPLNPPEFARCALVDGPAHRHHRDRHRVRDRRRIGSQGADQRLRGPLYRRLCGGSAGRASGRRVHRDHPATADPFLRGAGLLLAVPRTQDRQHQRPPDQLRLSPHRAFPADAGHRRCRPADRTGQVVFRHVTTHDGSGADTGRPPAHRRRKVVLRRASPRNCTRFCAPISTRTMPRTRPPPTPAGPARRGLLPEPAGRRGAPGPRRAPAGAAPGTPGSRWTTQEPPVERPRRSSRRSPAPARDYDAYDAPQPPRRSRRRRPEADPDLRGQPPREARREPRTRRGSYERPAARSGRFDAYDMYDRPGAPEHFGRYEPQYEPPRRRATNGAGPTHHPISQVRYRGAPPDEPRAEGRSRPPTNGRSPAESWEYDV